jgi:alanine racemase
MHDMEVPIVGRVSMDLTILDVTDARLTVETGGVAIFRGAHLEAEAGVGDTLNYELLVRLGQRCRRDYWKPKKEPVDRR